MKVNEVINFINKVEEEYPVDEWTLDNINIWPIVRIILVAKLRNKTINTNNLLMNKKKFIFSKIISKLYIIIQAIINNIQTNNYKKVDALFLTNSICRIELDGVWYDRICDPIINEVKKKEKSYRVFEMAKDNGYRTPTKYPSLFIRPLIEFINIKIRLFNKKKYIRNNGLDDLLKSWDKFKKYVDISTSVRISDNDINYIVAFINELANRLEKRLNALSPDIVFIECYYSSIGFAMCLACNRLRLPSVDIQHGVQGNYHMAYGSWNKVPQNGYDLLPNYFWCWSEYEVQAINSWALKTTKHRAIVGGNPWLAMWMDMDNQLVKKYNDRINKLKGNKVLIKKHIMITLQTIIEPWVLAAIKNAPSDWFWWVRLHPGMFHKRDEIRNLFQGNKIINWELDMATDFPLLAWLNNIDVHVTSTSTVILEAKAFGVPSVSTNENVVYLFPEQIKSGWVKLALNPEELINNINIQSKNINFKKGDCKVLFDTIDLENLFRSQPESI